MRFRLPKRPEPEPDWQTLVDGLSFAAAIAWGKPAHEWVAPYRYNARVVAEHYYASVLAGNLDLDSIDAELFALDYALEALP